MIEHVFTLERLSKWPMVAWMEYGDGRSTQGPGVYGISVFPASSNGIVEAARRCFTEQGIGGEPPADFHETHVYGPLPGSPDAYVENTLGDVLPWAQDCAMIQPVSFALADALRRHFHPHLPMERFKRLVDLPNTSRTSSGLRFSKEIQTVLRNGFYARRSNTEQKAVLEFLLEKIDEAEPKDGKSLKHLKWEAIKERVALELDPDHDLQRFAQIAKTPVGGSIRAELDNFGFRGEKDKIPLRLKPVNEYALQRLVRIKESFGIPEFLLFPLGWGQKWILAVMVLLFFGFSAFGIKSWLDMSESVQLLQIAGDEKVPAKLDVKSGETWQSVKTGEIRSFQNTRLSENTDYRLTVYGVGRNTSETFQRAKSQATRVSMRMQNVQGACEKEFPEMGLSRFDCPATSDNKTLDLMTWREKLGDDPPENRIMSVGLEISEPGDDSRLEGLRNLLLRSSSIDFFYRIQPDKAGVFHIGESLNQIREDLGPMIGNSQLVFWNSSRQIVDMNAFDGFACTLRLGSGGDLSWVEALNEILKQTGNILVTDEDIAKGLSKEQFQIKGASIALLREDKPRTNPPSRLRMWRKEQE